VRPDLLVRVTADPIGAGEAVEFVSDPAAGGTCLFLGTVRDHSDAGAVTGLTYEAWEEQAERRLEEVADELCSRLLKLFRRGPDGRRPVFGSYEKFQTDPHLKDYLLFYEYFHGDNGRGCGASHQTGWTGLVGMLVELFGATDAAAWLELGRSAAVSRRPARENPHEESTHV